MTAPQPRWVSDSKDGTDWNYEIAPDRPLCGWAFISADPANGYCWSVPGTGGCNVYAPTLREAARLVEAAWAARVAK